MPSDGLALCVAARSEADDEEDPQTRLTLHANRAACSLALKNYGECVKDCKAALAIDQTNAKAAYRLARALIGLKKHKQARDAAQWGLASAPDDKALTKTLAEAQLDLAQAGAAAKVAAKQRGGGGDAPRRLRRLRRVERAPQARAAGDGPRLRRLALSGGRGAARARRLRLPGGRRRAPDLLGGLRAGRSIADWLLTLFPDDNGPAWDTTEAYRAPLVKCYARLRQVASLLQGRRVRRV